MSNIATTLFVTALMAAPASAAFKLTEVSPRVFSPREGNTAINRAWFRFANPDGAEVTIRIFDINGRLVRRNLEYSGADMFWNGRDQGGALVKGGVYLYQIETGDKVLTGTVVVAI